MADSLYREIILEHWQNPQNYGNLANPDIDVSELNPLCGDKIRIMAKIKNKMIEDISFVADGCAISKASGSMLTIMAKKMPINKFLKLEAEDFLKTFNIPFSPARVKCVLLGFSTFKKALGEYRK
jgi:nitrogen fixation protein NifU and related proteins